MKRKIAAREKRTFSNSLCSLERNLASSKVLCWRLPTENPQFCQSLVYSDRHENVAVFPVELNKAEQCTADHYGNTQSSCHVSFVDKWYRVVQRDVQLLSEEKRRQCEPVSDAGWLAVVCLYAFWASARTWLSRPLSTVTTSRDRQPDNNTSRQAIGSLTARGKKYRFLLQKACEECRHTI